jgi:hypothetical protein
MPAANVLYPKGRAHGCALRAAGYLQAARLQGLLQCWSMSAARYSRAATPAAVAAIVGRSPSMLTVSRCQMLMWQAAPSVHTATSDPHGDTARQVTPISAGTWKLPVRVVLLLLAANTCSSGLRPCSTRARCPEAALAAMAATPCRGAVINRCVEATARNRSGVW